MNQCTQGCQCWLATQVRSQGAGLLWTVYTRAQVTLGMMSTTAIQKCDWSSWASSALVSSGLNSILAMASWASACLHRHPWVSIQCLWCLCCYNYTVTESPASKFKASVGMFTLQLHLWILAQIPCDFTAIGAGASKIKTTLCKPQSHLWLYCGCTSLCFISKGMLPTQPKAELFCLGSDFFNPN